MNYSGGCLCGNVRYVINMQTVFAGNCHCTDCQRVSGGAYAPVMMFHQGAVEISGAPRYYSSLGDSGSRVERGFCQDCGSQLFVKLEAIPNLLGVRPGTLDDPSQFKPSMDFYVSSAQPWNPMDPSIPKRPLSPRD